jgi:hypothetical protein
MQLSTGIKTTLRYLGPACAALAGYLANAGLALYAAPLAAVSLLCMRLTVSGVQPSDLIKLAMGVVGTTCAALAAAFPQYALPLGMIATACAAQASQAPGTATKIEAALATPVAPTPTT